ncbi:splicing factor, suppressor of white-apricot homolog isoform X1 [Osmia bicornis bicornis]|uniref:splicing factor, suppressor of white-apricot homolog isoform X1 n=1 Tax=Osmia bicornis bicornis TaxID=1437191 RepID=UPI0010F485A6|nr:splicing factor, suppressor of white-apricot homolog isoform X1 [Osmia bicornis bicornis]
MAASKSQRWMVDSGILRKKNGEEEPQELLVFGYSCKLFRDDDKAKMIDQGKHLIPWMGDNTLKIDRYDGRGALGDLRIYEPPTGGFDQRTILTEEELKVEQLCDEERYRSLYNNEMEDSIHHEEEIKRLHQALDSENTYGQVGYDYNEEGKTATGSKSTCDDSQSPKRSEGSQEEDQAFVPPPDLEIPDGIPLPETQKLNAIITKTALFISRQGGQMEILIKAKQANNPQFSFLSIDGPLHQYYRYILDAIKSGKYNPEKQPEKEEESEPEDGSSDQDDEPYLHPSLAPSFTKIEAAPSIPSIQYKPSADCAYSMLVNKITGKPPPSKAPPQQLESTGQATATAAGYYHPVAGQGYSPFPAAAPVQYSHGPVIYGPNGQIQSPLQLAPINTVSSPNDSLAAHVAITECQPPLVPYGTTSQKQLSRPSFIVPPADVQIIIDKMASYVAKNGRDFEAIVKNKGDPRFNFLELSHQYHGYYAHKLTIYEGAVNPKVLTEEELLQKQEPQEEKQKKLEELQKKQQRMEEVQKRVKMIQAKKKCDTRMKQTTTTTTSTTTITTSSTGGGLKQVTTVSFSIKKPKEGETGVIEKRNALPLEESDEEMGSENKEGNSKPSSPQDSMEQNFLTAVGTMDKDAWKTEKKPKNEEKELVDLTDEILEDCQKEIRHNKQNEERIKDKLVAAARDKLAATSRERQLQLERKKKAAAFLSQIQTNVLSKSSGHSSHSGNSGGSVGQGARKDDSDEVHSVPSPSPSPSLDDAKSCDSRSGGNSLMDRLKSADLTGKRSRPRSRSCSRSRSCTDRQRFHKKHKKKKSSHRSHDSPSSSRSHRSKKSKKSSSKHRSPSRTPSRRHQHNARRKGSNSSYSDSSSP